MPKAVIFDVDGTLVDSVDLHALAWQRTFAHFKVDTDYLQVRKQIGKGADKLMPVFLSDKQVKQQGDEIREYRDRLFHSEFQHLVRPFSGARRLIEQILNEGMKVALASSAKSEDLSFYKQLLGVEKLLHAETSSDDADESKPEPDIFEAALEGLHLTNPAEAIVVGDTPHDAEAATKAKMMALGFLCGGVPEGEMWDAGFIDVYFGPAHLMGSLQRSPILLRK